MLTGVPDSLKTLVILLVAVVPGACFVWGYERVRRHRQGRLTIEGQKLEGNERVLVFLLAAIGYHLVLGWPEYLAWRYWMRGSSDFTPDRFGLAWVTVACAVALPAAAGWIAARLWPLHSTRTDAWSVALEDLGSGYLVVTTTDGSSIAGRFAGHSVAGLGDQRDLYLEEEHELQPDGLLGPGRGYALFVPASSIRWVALIPGLGEENEP